ncbi:MAG: hypothetical protein S4CHLAM2_08740 [Chlamydiales bacterium]|nr:hypothetical protein [Chlamydiales bacterium]
MVEIYSYDITTHERFARDQQEIEAFRKQYHIPPGRAKIVAVHTRVLDFVPKHPALVLLMQTYQRKMWARFMIPKNYYTQRFASSYVAPSLGGTKKQSADIHKIHAFLKNQTRGRKVRSREERKDQDESEKNRDEQLVDEGEVIVDMIEKGVKETNEMIDYIISRMHQFVQA